jgi:hypothetical protein
VPIAFVEANVISHFEDRVVTEKAEAEEDEEEEEEPMTKKG